jgi:hypothetical protein
MKKRKSITVPVIEGHILLLPIQSLMVWLSLILLSACTGTDRNEGLLDISEVLQRGHRFNNWFYTRLDSLSQCIFDKSFTLEDLKNFREKVEDELGKEIALLNEIPHAFWAKNENMYGYIRYSKFSKVDRPVKTDFGFDRKNNIYTFTVQTIPEEAPTVFAEYHTKTTLRLPFEGEWYVAAGGRTLNVNHHTVASDQRFAYDFIITKEGISFWSNGSTNEDYFCYTKKILAPGDGIVVDVVNDIRENKIGEMPNSSGNRVIIDHLNGEFSILAHFKYRSIVVKVGDAIKSGQLLGLCGNSGHSSEPHLHYHLQNAPVMFQGDGLPAQFLNYLADGVAVDRGEPCWHQRVSQN